MPIVVSLFDWPEPIAESTRCLIDLGPLAIGANCQDGMGPALKLARALRLATDHLLWVKPAAGLPGPSLETPSQFQAGAAELMALGVRMIGGCCGTTEDHVAAMRLALDDSNGGRKP